LSRSIVFVLGPIMAGFLSGCGNVSGRPDAVVDCGAGMHVGYTGACEANCTEPSCDADSTCNLQTGVCEYASCYHLRAAIPAVTDGPQPIRPVSNQPAIEAYCSGPWTYVGVGFGSFLDDLGRDYAGYEQLRVADLQSAFAQRGFVWAYNKQSGLTNLAEGSTGGECCFKSFYDGLLDVQLGGDAVTPANLDGTANCGGPYDDSAIRFAHGAAVAPTPLPDDYFSSSPVTSGAGCAEGDNPAFFVKRMTGLASCAAIIDEQMSEGDGLYTIDTDALGPTPPEEVVCNMTDRETLHEVVVGRADQAYPNYDLITVADLGEPTIQLALLRAYGRQAGLPILDDITIGECCVAPGATGGFSIGGAVLQIARPGGGACAGAYTRGNAALLAFGTTPQDPPLRRDYFDGRTVTTSTACPVSSNPGLFIRRD
jgi:hypothetical protein